jgi:hypothetical protein
MLYQRADKILKRRAATGGKVPGRARGIVVPITPAFAIATGAGDPAVGWCSAIRSSHISKFFQS